MSITERNDVRWALVVAATDNDGGLGYLIGHDGVTKMKIVKRHGPMDWIPYVEVWQGDHLHAELPQHNCLAVEFAKATL